VCMSLSNISKLVEIEYIATQAIDRVRPERTKSQRGHAASKSHLTSCLFFKFPSQLSPADSVMDDKNVCRRGTSIGKVVFRSHYMLHTHSIFRDFCSEMFRVGM